MECTFYEKGLLDSPFGKMVTSVAIFLSAALMLTLKHLDAPSDEILYIVTP